MTSPLFTVRRLGKEDRSGFSCGKDALDHYFRKQISQDVRRQLATAFVIWHEPTATIAGFYTLSAAQIPFTDLDEDWRKRLPVYPSLPAVLIGRLAVAEAFRRQKLGAALLADAAGRAIISDIAARFLLVDAIDEDATLFYQHHGFRRLPGTGSRLYIPVSAFTNRRDG